jgi:2',3'-cyclic-nucleotide 2'-phosphodiesterase (5'-nucleotidase family)
VTIETTTKTSLASQEPVVVGAAVAWLLAQVGAIVVGHTHVVTDAQWGSVATYLTPIVSAAVLAAVAWVTRQFTVPAAKVVEVKPASVVTLPAATYTPEHASTETTPVVLPSTVPDVPKFQPES